MTLEGVAAMIIAVAIIFLIGVVSIRLDKVEEWQIPESQRQQPNTKNLQGQSKTPTAPK